MVYRKLGNTDLEISAIAFGAWAIGGWMWGGNDETDSVKAIQKAFDLGITTFDTAPVYGFGKSEELLGRALADIPREKVQILTKYGLRWDSDRGVHHFDSKDDKGNDISIFKYAAKESIIQECNQSLKRLNTDYIDLYQIHWPDPSTPISETMEAMSLLIDEGKIRATGVCNYGANQVSEALETFPIASNQVPYSMINRGVEADIIPQAINNNLGILAYSPLQRGLLTGKINANFRFGEGDHRPNTPHFKPENIKRVNTFLNNIHYIAENKGVTQSQLVINWTVQVPGVTCALVGARNVTQSEENAKALDFTLSEDEMDVVNGRLGELELDL